MMYRRLTITVLLFFVISTVDGQQNEEESIGVTTNVSEADRSVDIPRRKFDMPSMIDTTIPIPTIDYHILPRMMEVSYDVEPIKPARIKLFEPRQKLYPGYVKAGVGTYLTPLLDLHYTSKRDRDKFWGLNARHLSSRGGLKDYGYNGFSDNLIHFYAQKMMDDYTISGDLSYELNNLHYYGYRKDSFPDVKREDIRQQFHTVNGGARMKSYFADSNKLNYDIGMRYGFFGDLRDQSDSSKFDFAREHRVVVDAYLTKFIKSELYGLDASVDFNHYDSGVLDRCDTCAFQPNTLVSNNAIINLNPYINKEGKNWSFKAGLKIMANIPHQVSTNANFHFYPDAEFKYSFFDDIFIPYIGVTGGIERNSFKSLANTNPWMVSVLQPLNTNNKLNVFGGVRGTFSSASSFNLKVATVNKLNMPLFVSDTLFSDQTRFNVVYDTVRVTSFTGQWSWRMKDRLRLNLKAAYFLYDNDSDLPVWYLPDFKFGGTVQYNLEDKVIAGFSTFVESGRVAPSLRPVENVDPTDEGIYLVDLGTFIDMNLHLEYRYTKRVSAFLNINNIASKKYSRWLNYCVQPIQVLGGVTYSF